MAKIIESQRRVCIVKLNFPTSPVLWVPSTSPVATIIPVSELPSESQVFIYNLPNLTSY